MANTAIAATVAGGAFKSQALCAARAQITIANRPPPAWDSPDRLNPLAQMQLAKPEQANDANCDQIDCHNIVEQTGGDQNQNASDDRKDWRNGQVKVHEVTPDLKGRIAQLTNSFGGTSPGSLGAGRARIRLETRRQIKHMR
jgi:hypothetical protein